MKKRPQGRLNHRHRSHLETAPAGSTAGLGEGLVSRHRSVTFKAIRASQSRDPLQHRKNDQPLPGGSGEFEVDAAVLIGLFGRSQIEFVDRDLTMILIQNIERGSGQDVVMNLLTRTAVFEHQGDQLLAGLNRGLRCRRLRRGRTIGRARVRSRRHWLPLIGLLRIVLL
jgi:hypothetical protein